MFSENKKVRRNESFNEVESICQNGLVIKSKIKYKVPKSLFTSVWKWVEIEINKPFETQQKNSHAIKINVNGACDFLHWRRLYSFLSDNQMPNSFIVFDEVKLCFTYTYRLVLEKKHAACIPVHTLNSTYVWTCQSFVQLKENVEHVLYKNQVPSVPTDFFSPVEKVSVPGSTSEDNVYHTKGFWPRRWSGKVNFQVNKKICMSVYTLHKIMHDWPMCIVNRIFELSRKFT